jgi:uncharacterized membrane protein
MLMLHLVRFRVFSAMMFGVLAFFWSLTTLVRGAVIINEIMYHHPANEMFEFVELFNSDSAASVSLANWTLKIGASHNLFKLTHQHYE